jgi:hypothetical protein
MDVGKWFSPLVKRFYGGCPTVDIQVLQYLLVVMSGKCAIGTVAQLKLQFYNVNEKECHNYDASTGYALHPIAHSSYNNHPRRRRQRNVSRTRQERRKVRNPQAKDNREPVKKTAPTEGAALLKNLGHDPDVERAGTRKAAAAPTESEQQEKARFPQPTAFSFHVLATHLSENIASRRIGDTKRLRGGVSSTGSVSQ